MYRALRIKLNIDPLDGQHLCPLFSIGDEMFPSVKAAKEREGVV